MFQFAIRETFTVPTEQVNDTLSLASVLLSARLFKAGTRPAFEQFT
jgi:hypothetical protein